jgi:hypothetical protein
MGGVSHSRNNRFERSPAGFPTGCKRPQCGERPLKHNARGVLIASQGQAAITSRNHKHHSLGKVLGSTSSSSCSKCRAPNLAALLTVRSTPPNPVDATASAFFSDRRLGLGVPTRLGTAASFAGTNARPGLRHRRQGLARPRPFARVDSLARAGATRHANRRSVRHLGSGRPFVGLEARPPIVSARRPTRVDERHIER